jgi:hypothetical protein
LGAFDVYHTNLRKLGIILKVGMAVSSSIKCTCSYRLNSLTVWFHLAFPFSTAHSCNGLESQ